MRLQRQVLVAMTSLLFLTPWVASAQGSTVSSSADRLFLNFIEDAMRVDDQWWEGQLEFAEGDVVDVTTLRGVVAFQPLRDFEFGGRVGFANSDGPAGFPDGSGATDLDLWGKYYLNPGNGQNEFAVGGVLTVPTGDDTAGLGSDAFSLGVFGAVRHRLNRAVITGKLGLRVSGDGRMFGSPERDGEVSPSLGVGIIAPWTDRLGFVGEFNFESERFDGGEDDSRILGGVNWRVGNRGMVRGALGIGLSDGAPDAQLIGGYAYTF